MPEAPPFDARVGPSRSARFLSNGTTVVLATAAGTGASRHDGIALTPWRFDGVESAPGLHFYLRDLDAGDVWRVDGGSRDGAIDADGTDEARESHWWPGRITLVRVRSGVRAELDCAVAPGEPLELRRLTLTNEGPADRHLDVTSFAEVVLNDDRTHGAHPGFSRLFVQTSVDPERRALIVTRRPRALGEIHPALVHALVEPGPIAWETDRARFLGRGSRVLPAALSDTLSGTTGNVLDPITSLRRAVRLRAGERKTLTFVLAASVDRSELDAAIGRLASPHGADEVFRAAEAHAACAMGSLTVAEAAYLEALAGAALHGAPELRAAAERSSGLSDTIDAIGALGLDPGRSACLLHAERPDGAALSASAMAAAAYWRALGAPIDLWIVTDDASLAAESTRRGARVLAPRDAGEHALALADAVARVVLLDGWPELHPPSWSPAGRASASVPPPDRPPERPASPPSRGAAANGRDADASFTHGFSSDGREYILRLSRGVDGALALPPRPWINVIANETFGCLVSETGAGHTWSGNSQQNRLTPWHNDPVADPHGEALYVRDESSGAYWSPLPGPTPGGGAYEVRHGWGYTTCLHTHGDLVEETDIFVPGDDSVKITRVRVRNGGGTARRLSLFAYHHLVLGHTPEDSAATVRAAYDVEIGAVLARNVVLRDGGGGVTYGTLVAPATAERHAETHRARFIGPGGSVAAPRALSWTALGPADAVAGDACCALQVTLDVPPGETVEVALLLGTAPDAGAARDRVIAYRRAGAIQAALESARAFWRNGLSRVHVSTPSPALDTMVNGWLAYQTVACRLWGRSAFYQSGGAFGFRDQLQDACAVVHLWPEMTREQILRSAAHQFVEGDVLHWWHSPHDRGIRTRFVDDLLWLPYVIASYVRTTGDTALLDTSVPFLRGRSLRPGEDEALLLPEIAAERGDVYEHACRAVDLSLSTGAHGLPLFGTGDWNDGMNRVGREGRGESVWMAFFLVFVLDRFLPICRLRGDRDRERRYARHREMLIASVNDAGWDGDWYRRGFYDDGDPLGSHASDECRIDALVQAWSVLSGAAPPARAVRAMDALMQHLVDEEAGLVRLLTPPFEHTPKDPGYIRGYVRGVRENGGQYTHAAMWVVRAFAELGRRDDAVRLLDMLNPIHHTRTPEDVARYQVEPYVVAADVYGEPPHVGRGGWTWYTGSSGWMLRVALESILGVSVHRGRTLVIAPRVPDEWPGFRLDYTAPGTTTRYAIEVESPDRVSATVVRAMLDGEVAPVEDGAARIPIVDDGATHRVVLTLGPGASDTPRDGAPSAPTRQDA